MTHVGLAGPRSADTIDARTRDRVTQLLIDLGPSTAAELSRGWACHLPESVAISLEAAIEKLTAVLEEVRDQNTQIMGMAAKRIAEAGADKPKGKATTKAKEDTKGTDDAGGSDASATTKTVLTDAFKAWMGEFGAKPDFGILNRLHVMRSRRRRLPRFSATARPSRILAEDDQASIDRLYNWLENTAKKADKGHGIGRLVADPAPETSDEDDGLGV